MDATIKQDRLWTRNFVQAYVSNFLLYTALYMLLPVLPFYISGKFGVSLTVSGLIMGVFALSMFFFGPFYSYLIDAFKRKRICMLSVLAVTAVFGGYISSGTLLWITILRIMQGSFFGVASTLGTTVAIDITTSKRRSESNTCFSWASRLGMVAGPIIGLYLYQYKDALAVFHASIVAGVLAFLFISMVHVPFRAPMGSCLCTIDRFLLPKGWIASLNLVLISFSFGALLVGINVYALSVNQQGVISYFFALMGGGFILAMIANKLVFENADIRSQIMSGLILMGASLLLLITHVQFTAFLTAAVLMGLGLGLVASNFLLIFIKLSEHCQRGTANTTYCLSWEVGVAAGLIEGCYLIENQSFIAVFQVCVIVLSVASVFFLIFTNGHFHRNKKR